MYNAAASRARQTTAIPTPIPAFAPTESDLEESCEDGGFDAPGSDVGDIMLGDLSGSIVVDVMLEDACGSPVDDVSRFWDDDTVG